jgi:Cytochrome C oxidase, cbb3-type, subunit III
VKEVSGFGFRVSGFVAPASARRSDGLCPPGRAKARVTRGRGPKPETRNSKLVSWLAGLLLMALLCVGCRQDMHNNGRLKPLEESVFFTDRRASRPLIPGTVPRGALNEDEFLLTAKVGDRFVKGFPFPVTRELLNRGQERYGIYCAVCHGPTGRGDGMIVQRGFPQPPSFHEPRLREAPEGYFFNVITRGYGVMYSYADRVEPPDRWAIVAYLRALQLSRAGRPDDVPEAERPHLEQISE